MIKKEDIKVILKSTRQEWATVSEKDIAFVVLCDTFADKSVAYKMAYGRVATDAEAHYCTTRMLKLRDVLEPFGIGSVNEELITREQNKTELIRLLKEIKALAESKKIDAKDAVKMEADIRVKLNDKFEMEASQTQKRIIVVPQKHDIICPHTNRECTYMPTKEACMKYYGLKDKGSAV